MKPRIHIFRGRYYCVGNGVGHGLTPELAYYSWRDACAGAGLAPYIRQCLKDQPSGYWWHDVLNRTTGVTHTPVIS